jgi:hypothetical protein
MKRNGCELVVGDHWLLCGPRRDFDQPHEVEIVDIDRRREARIRFVDGRLEGRTQWCPVAWLFAPMDQVDKVQTRLEFEAAVDDQAISEAERWAVLDVASAFGQEFLTGWYGDCCDVDRVAELLDCPVGDITGVPLAEVCNDDRRRWHLPGRHQLHLARRLAAKYPVVVHEYGRADLRASQLAYSQRDYDLPAVHRAAYLLVCSWCHVEPNCDLFDRVEQYRTEAGWLYEQLCQVLKKLKDYSPQAASYQTREVRKHYGWLDRQWLEPQWSGLPSHDI